MYSVEALALVADPGTAFGIDFDRVSKTRKVCLCRLDPKVCC